MTRKGDEGRGMAAISYGEVPNNLRSVDFRMGEPNKVTPYNLRKQEHTQGIETSQYLEEKKPNSIPLVAASENGEAQTSSFRRGVVRYCRRIYTRKVTKVFVSRNSWEAVPQRVIVPYTKTKTLFRQYS